MCRRGADARRCARPGFTLIELPFDGLRAVRQGERQAFTLIELLVVIAILALLVTLLAPMLRRAKDLARQALCATNLHQIGLANYNYSHDTNGQLAGGKDVELWGLPAEPGRAHNQMSAWKWWLYPYAAGEARPYWPRTPDGGGRIFLCPSTEPLLATEDNRLNYLKSSYGRNFLIQAHLQQVGGTGLDPTTSFYKKVIRTIDQPRRPMETLLVCDSGQPPEVHDTKFCSDTIYAHPRSSYTGIGPFRHFGRGNLLMFDGHVESRTGEDVCMPWNTPTVEAQKLRELLFHPD